MRHIWIIAGAALAVLLSSRASDAQYKAPDMVLVNGKIVTVNSRGTVAQALAVRDGRISAVGSSARIRKLASPKTRVIDLGGHTVIPGLIDSHNHAIRAGLTYGIELDWSGITSLHSALETIRAAARKASPGTWIIVTGGWDKKQFTEKRLPTPKELGEAAPDHPVYVQHHYEFALLNPLAIKTLKITAESKIPPAGKVQLDASGQPTGVIEGHGNVPTFAGLAGRLPKPTFKREVEGTRAYFHALNATGITGIIDGGGGGLFPAGYQPLFALWRQRELTLRVRYFVMSQKRGGEFADMKSLLQMVPPRWGDGWLRSLGLGEVLVWGMHDGATTGMAFNPGPEPKKAFFEFASWAASNGYTVQVHASSNHSAEQILDIFEQINKTTPITGLRWGILHLEDATDETLRRMKALGMEYGVQDRLYFEGDEYVEKLGDKIARRSPPIVSAARMGLVVAGGTDSTVESPYNPFVSLQWFLTGKTVSGTPTRGPEELPSRLEALKIYTLNSAWASFEEHQRGSLEPGKLADLAVLDRDYMTVPVDEVAKTKSLLTMVGGRVVYATGPFAALNDKRPVASLTEKGEK